MQPPYYVDKVAQLNGEQDAHYVYFIVCTATSFVWSTLNFNF